MSYERSTNIYRYRVINNITEQVVFEGTSKEIAAITGASQGHITDAAREGKTICRGRYRIVDISEDVKRTQPFKSDTSLIAAAKRWDEFCEPIRKKYGIPVYRQGKEVRR